MRKPASLTVATFTVLVSVVVLSPRSLASELGGGTSEAANASRSQAGASIVARNPRSIETWPDKPYRYAEVTLTPVADADVSQAQPNEKFGTETTLRVHADEPPLGTGANHVYLRFDLSSLQHDAIIVEASLTMVAFRGHAWGGDGRVFAHRVSSDSWTESNTIWNSCPTYGEVLGSWWLWYDFSTPGDQIGSFTTPELATAVQEEANGDNRLSLMLRSPGYDTDYRSREYSVADQRPKLRVRYTTMVDVPPTSSSTNLSLGTVVPNPVANEAILRFTTAVAGDVRLDLVDLNGRRLATLWNGSTSPGSHEVRWKRRADSAERIPAGIYFARLSMAGEAATRRVVVID